MVEKLEDSSDESQVIKKADNCPFIGLKADPGSFIGYATEANFCFHASPSASIILLHQEKFCLTDSYRDCEVFYSSGLEPLPAEIKGDFTKKSTKQLKNNLIRFGIPSILGLVVILFFLFLIFERPLYGNSNASISNPPIQPLLSETNLISHITPSPTTQELYETEDFIMRLLKEGTPSASLTPSISPSPTLPHTPTATYTPEITAGPGLETPFGPDGSFLLHVVSGGESYPRIAEIFDTSVEVLNTTNIIPEGLGLREGIVIVVMPGTNDPQGLPDFVAILVDKPMSLEEIAQVYQSNSAEIQEYNALNPEKPIPVGRWLVIPYWTKLD